VTVIGAVECGTKPGSTKPTWKLLEDKMTITPFIPEKIDIEPIQFKIGDTGTVTIDFQEHRVLIHDPSTEIARDEIEISFYRWEGWEGSMKMIKIWGSDPILGPISKEVQMKVYREIEDFNKKRWNGRWNE
jgi:hypothetical protein